MTENANASQAALATRLRTAVAILVIAAGVTTVYSHEPRVESPQARRVMRSVEAPSLAASLEKHSAKRPPLYVLTLRAYTGLGFPARSFHPLLFGGLLVWAWLFVRRVAAPVAPAVPVSFLALAHFHYPVMATFVSETLFTLVVALFFSALLAHLRNPTRLHYLLLALAAAAACATRYFGFFWLVPLGALNLLVVAGRPVKQRIAEAVGLGVLAVAPLVPWMLEARSRTGFLTVKDLLGTRESVFRHDLQGIDHVLFTVWQFGKTIFVDFFSTSTAANHAAVNEAYAVSPLEVAVAILAAGCALAGLALVREDALASLRRMLPERGAASPVPSEAMLLAQMVVWFAVVTLALWFVSSNDRLYNRFLFPCYPFGVLLAFVVYSRIRSASVDSARLLPFRALYVAVLAVQCARSFRFLYAG